MSTTNRWFFRYISTTLLMVLVLTTVASLVYVKVYDADWLQSMIFLSSAGCIIAAISVTRNYIVFIKPVNELSRQVSDVMRSPIFRKIEIARQGEISQLIANVNKCLVSMNEMALRGFSVATEIQESTFSLYRESESLERNMAVVADKAGRTLSNANDVVRLLGDANKSTDTTAGEIAQVEKSINLMVGSVNNAGDSVEKSRENIDMVLTASEEMSATVQDIAANASNARQSTSTAVTRALTAQESVDQLKAAAAEINKIIDVIVEIAEQTKLLALNATIEAARAGEAGKGFSVVAGEVKDLARQTNEATADIRKKIAIMHSSIDNTITEITQISGVVNDVDQIVSSIASAVEEQSITTREIAKNIGSAALIVEDMNGRTIDVKSEINRLAESVSRIGNSMSLARNDIGKAVESTTGIRNEVNEILKNSEEVNSTIKKFNTGFSSVQKASQHQFASINPMLKKQGV